MVVKTAKIKHSTQGVAPAAPAAGNYFHYASPLLGHEDGQGAVADYQGSGHDVAPPFYGDSPPNAQVFDYLSWLNSQPQSTGSAGTIVPPYHPNPSAADNDDTHRISYLTDIRYNNIPEYIYNSVYSKDVYQKTQEANIVDLDFSNVLPIGLISIILYSYI